jgi:arylsulfatase A-like enzyme
MGALIGALLIASFVLAREQGNPGTPLARDVPNILIIVTDDQRGGLEMLPFTRRWFGKSGSMYKRAYANTPVCCPSRASIFTGRYAHNHGVRASIEPFWRELDPETTIHRYLQDAGYRTALFGKYLNHFPLSADPPNFDRWVTASAIRYRPGDWNVNGKTRWIDRYATDLLAREASRFVTKNAGRPWFAYVAVTAPHTPSVPAPRHRDAPVPRWRPGPAVFERDVRDKPPAWRTRPYDAVWGRRVRRKQFRTLPAVDDMVKRLVGALEDTNQSSDTLVFFTSDNGYLWGEHGLAKKRYPYTESSRVALLARWPGHIPRRIDRRLVGNVDIAPTVLDAAGIEPGPRMDGRSLLERFERDHMLLEMPHWGTPQTPQWASVITHRKQYVEYYDQSGDRFFRELYNLADDPHQLHNLLWIKGNRTRSAPRWSAILRKDRSCEGSSCP